MELPAPGASMICYHGTSSSVVQFGDTLPNPFKVVSSLIGITFVMLLNIEEKNELSIIQYYTIYRDARCDREVGQSQATKHSRLQKARA